MDALGKAPVGWWPEAIPSPWGPLWLQNKGLFLQHAEWVHDSKSQWPLSGSKQRKSMSLPSPVLHWKRKIWTHKACVMREGSMQPYWAPQSKRNTWPSSRPITLRVHGRAPPLLGLTLPLCEKPLLLPSSSLPPSPFLGLEEEVATLPWLHWCLGKRRRSHYVQSQPLAGTMQWLLPTQNPKWLGLKEKVAVSSFKPALCWCLARRVRNHLIWSQLLTGTTQQLLLSLQSPKWPGLKEKADWGSERGSAIS